MSTIFNTVFLVTFLLATALQYNDPDPLPWVGIYLLGALICILNLVDRQLAWLPPLLLCTSLGWAVYLLPSVVGQVSLAEVVQSISMQTRAIEEAREIGGLLILATWSAFVCVFQHRARR